MTGRTIEIGNQIMVGLPDSRLRSFKEYSELDQQLELLEQSMSESKSEKEVLKLFLSQEDFLKKVVRKIPNHNQRKVTGILLHTVLTLFKHLKRQGKVV